MNKEKVGEIIHNTIYTNPEYPHRGNNNILAANWILDEMGIRDIDMICDLAKIIDEHSTYDKEISDGDLDNIMLLFGEMIKEYRKNEENQNENSITSKMELKEIILKAEEKKELAYEKYAMGKDNVKITNAVQYYMDISNIFNELIENLKLIN